MKSRPLLALAMTAALGAATFAVVGADAQQPPAPPGPPPSAAGHPPPPAGGPGGFDFGPGGLDFGPGMGMGRMGHMKPEDRGAFLDARIAGVKAGLRLTPDQEKLWGPLETAVRDGMKRGEDMRAQLADKGRPADPIDGLARMADANTARGEVLHRIVDAARPLYASLTDDQKRRLDVLMHRGGHEGWRERVGERMRHWREWGEEHMGRGRQGALEPREPALFQHTSGAFQEEPFIVHPRLNDSEL